MVGATPEILVLIPARGGSKGIPGKNIKLLSGKPLIAWTIQAARAATAVCRVVVTTDSEEIAAVAREFHAEVPFLRPKELAADNTPGLDPVLHALQYLQREEGYCPDYVMLLQPTSPLRTAEDIDGAIQLALVTRADAVVGVCRVSQPPHWMKIIDMNGYLVNFMKDDCAHTRRQDLPDLYGLNGSIYLVRSQVVLQRRTFCPDSTRAYIMPQERSLDIDTPWDFYLAELILSSGGSHVSI